MRGWLAMIALGLLAAPCASEAHRATHDGNAGDAGVIALHRAGLGDDVILAKIASGPCIYDTSMGAMVQLKKAGLSDGVITAMVQRCAQGPAVEIGVREAPAANYPKHGGRRGGVQAGMSVAPYSAGLASADAPAVGAGNSRAAGIYLASGSEADARQTLLRPSAQSSLKYTGNGSILFPHMAKLIVSQPSSQIITESARPVFFFYFNLPDHKVNTFGTAATEAAQSPEEFSLVRFRQDAGNRQVTVGRVQPYVSISGIDPKNTLPFEVTDMGGGSFRVEMSQDLAPGEYGFVLNGTSEKGGAAKFRIYDFTVRGAMK